MIKTSVGHVILLDLLDAIPGAGYIWQFEETEGLKINIEYISNNYDHIGEITKCRAKINTLKKGEYDIVFKLMRPWEKEIVKENCYKISVI